MSRLAFAVFAVAVTVGAAAYYVGIGIIRSQQSTARLVSLRRTRREVMEAPFAERALAPVFQGLGRFAIRYTPSGWAARTRHRLVLAGMAGRFDANSWAALKVIALVVSMVVWFFFQPLLPGPQRILTFVLFLFLGLFAADGILNNRIEERRKAMRRQLPDILDLLVISVEAGLGFDAALSRVVQTVPGVMSDEFNRMLAETRVGVSRREAMQHLSERTDVDELDSFLLSMNQADSFGVSVARVLRVQADEMRTKRRQAAQERAFAAPVKMVFPLILTIFPALFVVLLGPAAIEVSRSLFNN